MWVVTRQIKVLNQDGEYFIGVFTMKPGFTQLRDLLPLESDVTIGRLTRGGGRYSNQGPWFYLSEVGDGESFA